MPTRRRISFALYAFVCLVLLGLAAAILSGSLEPAGDGAVAWRRTAPGGTVVADAFRAVAAAGLAGLLIVTLPLLLTRFRAGDRLARVVIPLGLLAVTVPAAIALAAVWLETPVVPLWYGAAAAVAGGVVGLVLDAPWASADRPRRLVTAAVAVIVPVLVGVAVLASGVVGRGVDVGLNTVLAAPRPGVSPEIAAFHDDLFIVDLHADTMMWDRDFLGASRVGHVDLDRLVKGNVALQVFAAVTKTVSARPAPDPGRLLVGATVCLSPDSLNQTGLLQVAQFSPLATWFDLEARAIHQARRLKRFIAETEAHDDGTSPRMVLIRTADDLDALIRQRRREQASGGRPRTVGALIAVEGAHWLGGGGTDPAAGVETLFAEGFRMLAPTHRFDNTLGASSEGCDPDSGLTADGAAFVGAVAHNGIVLDLAHAADATLEGAVGQGAGPVVISHTGSRTACLGYRDEAPRPGCDANRNISDEDVRTVARTGGIIGIGLWPEVGSNSVEEGMTHYRAVLSALAEPSFVEEMRAAHPAYDPTDHIALGTDFDGAVSTPYDAAGLPALTAALVVAPMPVPLDRTAIRKIAGANACRVFATRLPGGSAERAAQICAPLLSGTDGRTALTQNLGGVR
ncbi:dipeptidase [Acuticoccus sediminis]|uniref:dipeptidase n=1 Tax=Acuticoccus sediminis TaxID=2184697 RepID=UPI001CFDF2E5|nr:membrane dipeptidase [Acuticoccus sediminis]